MCEENCLECKTTKNNNFLKCLSLETKSNRDKTTQIIIDNHLLLATVQWRFASLIFSHRHLQDQVHCSGNWWEFITSIWRAFQQFYDEFCSICVDTKVWKLWIDKTRVQTGAAEAWLGNVIPSFVNILKQDTSLTRFRRKWRSRPWFRATRLRNWGSLWLQILKSKQRISGRIFGWLVSNTPN